MTPISGWKVWETPNTGARVSLAVGVLTAHADNLRGGGTLAHFVRGGTAFFNYAQRTMRQGAHTKPRTNTRFFF